MAKRVGTYQQNFAKGEIDPQLLGSPDLPGYYEGLADARNVWVTATGSLQKRYGMVDVVEFEDIPNVRLIPFTNTAGTHHLLAVQAGSIRIYEGETAQLLATIPATAITESVLPNLQWAAWGDSVIFTEEHIPPQQLKWNGGTNFTLTEISFTDVPAYEFSPNDVDPAATLTISARTGFVTATASASAFQASDVGKYIQILPLGRLQIQSYKSATVVTGYLVEELFDTTAVPSGNWTIERGWSPLWDTNGYPAVCAFHEGRLVLGNFPKARTTIAFSVVNSPFVFSSGDGSAAYGDTRTISMDQSEEIFHIASASSLAIFTASGEYVVDQSQHQDIHSAPIRHDSSRGCVRTIRPMEGEDGGLFYFQPNNTGISEFRFYMERGSYEGHSFTKYCGHLFHDPVRATLWKGDGNFAANILFFCNADGSLISGTVNLTEKIAAFTRTITDCPVRDICAVAGNIYCVVDGPSHPILRRFIRGSYVDNGQPFLTSITTLPVNAPGGAYVFDDISTTHISLYVSNTSRIHVNGQYVYNGPAFSGKLRHFLGSGWGSDGKIQISDGTGTEFWQLNGLGRSALAGGIG
jgi:hypothetical protein